MDSLKTVLHSANEDTGRVNALTGLAVELRKSDLDSAVSTGKQALELSTKIKWKKGIGFSNHILGIFFYMKGDYEESLKHDVVALGIWKEFSNSSNVSEANYGKLSTAKTSGNVANIYIDQANYPKALEYCFMALHVSEELGDTKVQAINFGNIGNIYKSQKQDDKALEFYNKALMLGKTLNDPLFILNQMNNIGSVYRERADYPKALEYYRGNLKMAEEKGIRQLQAGSLGNIGLVYIAQLKYDEAIVYFLKALGVAKEVGEKRLIVFNLINLGGTYRKTGKFKEAEKYLKDALLMAEEMGTTSHLMTIEDNLANLYDTTGRPVLALEHYKNYFIYRDSITNQANRKELFRSEVNYEFEKKELASKAEQEKKDALTAKEKQQQQTILYFVAIGGIIVLFFSLSLYKRFKVTQKQKTEIEYQKQIVEEHRKGMIDSITYAKRLQDAILPPAKFINKYVPDNFVVYKPKDIVAGDFYWAESVNVNNKELFFIAAADSTGHGVPGALVSVVCSNALNRTLKEFKETEPGKMLDKTRELVLETFVRKDSFGEKSSDEVKDGMDISLLCIDKITKQIWWSGANNSLWYTSANEGSEMKEIKADKQPIGKTENPKPFTTHAIKYTQGSVFYLFTDGFADQFGGPQGKKFKYKTFSELLLKNSGLKMEEQFKIIESTFNNWKGNLEQVDDVCVIGIKI
ncbi:MAG: tetratricopeptide repeat protein [Bacteroidia bacterium]